MSRFMTGLLMGVGIGLLLAPEKGADTRESIAETAGNLKDRFNRLVGRAGARIDDLKSLLENEVDGLSEDVRSRIRTILDEEGSMASSDSNGTSYRQEFRPM
jgi:gas vesicle protein